MIIIKCTNRKIESCLKEYRQKADKISQTQELRDRKTYDPPSQRKRKQKNFAKYKQKKYGDA